MGRRTLQRSRKKPLSLSSNIVSRVVMTSAPSSDFLDLNPQIMSALRKQVDDEVLDIDRRLNDKTLTDIDMAQLKLAKMKRYLTAGLCAEAQAALNEIHIPLVSSDAVFSCYLSFYGSPISTTIRTSIAFTYRSAKRF